MKYALLLLLALTACGVEGDLYRTEDPSVKHSSDRDNTPRPTRQWEDDGGELDRLNQ